MNARPQAETGQVIASAAEIYDAVFVPALFAQFAPILAEAAGIGPGARVLDVGCGTGVAALAAVGRAGSGGQVTGIDINPAMLAVARRKSATVRWIEAPAEALPFADESFDAVLCQFALMFLADRTAALREMRRVLRPGGRIALLVWDAVERTPGYRDLVALLGEIVGPAAAEALRAPFCLGDPAAITAELAAAGLAADEMRTVTGTARHPSLDAWIDTEIGGWTLAGTVDAATLARLKAAAHDRLARYVGPDGAIAFPAPAHLAIVRA